MRKILALLAMMALAGCGGGGGGTSTAPNPNPPAQATTTPQGNLVTPTFTIIIPPSSKTSGKVRKPNYVSPGTHSVVITLTSVDGNAATASGIKPNPVETDLNPPTCTSGCTVNGPPSPPGHLDAYSIVTYDTAGGTGNQLDRATASITPTAGQNNTVNVTLMGIPFTITISGVPTSWQANTAGQTKDLTVTVADHHGDTITGTYASPVTISDPDPETTNGTTVTCTPPNTGATCVATLNAGTNSSVSIADSTNGVRLNYGGLAENPVTLSSSNTDVTANSGTAGSGTFTPLLNAITSDGANPTTSYTGGGPGIDLFTTDNTSSIGYTGTVKYGELGFTNTPYNKQLTTNPTGSTGACSTFATIATGSNTSNETPFTATAIASPAAGVCTVTVTDNLTDQTNTLPTFKVTYTTSQVGASSKHRRQ
jgi:hypothetical protein